MTKVIRFARAGSLIFPRVSPPQPAPFTDVLLVLLRVLLAVAMSSSTIKTEGKVPDDLNPRVYVGTVPSRMLLLLSLPLLDANHRVASCSPA